MKFFRLLFNLISPAYFLFIIFLTSAGVSAQGISIDLGKTETGRYIKLTGNLAGNEGEIKNTSAGGEYCAENVKSSIFFQLDKNYFYQLPAGKFFIINVEYYDEPGVEIKLVYDAIDDANKEFGTTIKTTGTNKWKSYGFYLDSCYFGHRQANEADFRLVAASGKMHINTLSVVPVDYYFDWGTVNDSLGINQTERGGGDSHTKIVKVDGEEAIQTTEIDNYLYMSVNDSLIYAGNHPYLFVSVQYYDNNAAQTMRLQYDGLSNKYQPTAYAAGKGSNCWKTVTFEISDAWFQARQSGLTDLRLHLRLAGTPVNRIMIGLLDKAPLPPLPAPAVFSSYKTIDPPVIDGDLRDWAWQKTGSKLEYSINSDSSRTDEFYRTWLLDRQNVPIAEAGEPNVASPEKEGLWDYNDLSGEVKVFWDEDNLYVSGAIKDNVLSLKDGSWEGKDGIGFYFDVSHTVKDGKPQAIKDDLTYQKGENFIFIPASNTDPGLWKHAASQTGEALPSIIKRVFKATADGYIIEASIPMNLIKDGFTLNPGYTGNPDNFNPLFGYVVNDNDGISSQGGRLSFGAPNDDDETWGSLSLGQNPFTDNGIMTDLGAKNFNRFLSQVYNEDDGRVTLIEKDNKSCVVLSNGNIYLAIDNNLIFNGNHPHLFISVEYFDEPQTGKFRLQYDGAASAYQDGGWVSLTGTGRWKTATFEIKDARFYNRENGEADFRINSDEKNLILNQIRVSMADYWITRGDTTADGRTSGYKITSRDYLADGQVAREFIGGKYCHRNSVLSSLPSRYFYHAVDDSILYRGIHLGVETVTDLLVTVEYYDTLSSGGIAMNYDSRNSIWAQAAGNVIISGTNQWKLYTFHLPDPYFANRQPSMGDFRITGEGSGYTYIRNVMMGVITEIMLDVNKDERIPKEYSLLQNYPNPFNPATTISYSIPRQSSVELKIYDMLGREVKTLVRKDQDAGEYKVPFNASSLPSGIYIYTIQAGKFRDSKKLVLLK